ncbi:MULTISPECIES: DNA topoisomerase IV subunit B [unclassified Actinomyces]|uniref:DNA gyrase/topoisomerase IV subunit B n=1 Tax=unclassified Actinomyces TaxID=2609248 RepID=UPI0020178C22|nr:MULTISPECIES: DNA topoisomerase IV subunit B [unclassified Actinomyces]MCL3777562.1 type IIA DNA topoisomerase subunit B [Actinomyces sp. AC-20-1]MCL3790052.1 type IIA DNA topoisomerase subunit B [Actinomyces sp. 187325]MCL3791097.1 type IIA DNA topoisomerase subunit B [Actinomyces sp. 186855]MCL3794986.1 type IIA DNA topoisomerase subunit B [Actinomyces sp. 217892]
MSESSNSYSARHLSVLEGLEAVRKRPGMYIGSTDQRGLMHCVWEIVDNAVDEALEGHGTSIAVVVHADGSIEVRDTGRGVPVDVEPASGLTGVELVYTKLHAGGKFGGGSYGAAGGLHGVGASVVNALSVRMDVEVDRGGRTYAMSFHRGVPGVFDDGGRAPTPEAPFTEFTEASGLRVVGKVRRGVTGTRVRYWADPQIFPRPTEYDASALRARLRQTSFLVPGLTLTLADERPAEEAARAERTPSSGSGTDGLAQRTGARGATEEAGDLFGTSGDDGVETFLAKGGTRDFVDFLATDASVTDTFRLTGQGTYTETVQQLDKRSGHLRPVEVERTCAVDVALRWGIGYDTLERSFVNIIATPMGGTHLTGFEQAVTKVLRKQIDTNARALKVTARDARIEKDDILAGLTAVVTVRVPEPQFEGQTKEVLGTAPVRQIVAKVVETELGALLSSSKRDLKTQSRALQEKIVGEMRARVSARMHKELTRRKTALETSTLPAKLADCRSDDVSASELFIVEGDSALGTAKNARNSEFQALLPIRGKILNVQKASQADMLRNAECSAIIQVVGAGSGRTFDLDAARYGKVILMTDADVDGAHIRTLLLTLFFRYMRPMIEAGRVYAAVPPLHRIEVSAQGRRKKEIIYTYSDDELVRTLRRLEKQGRSFKEPQRYKGLGEMDAHQLAETTMEPEHRTLRRITLGDEAELLAAENVFELLMGQSVEPRRDFIIEGAHDIDRERIDA